MMNLRTIGFFTALAIFAISPDGPARATLLPTSGVFNIVFIQTTPLNTTHWDGMFVADAGVVTSFVAEIGNCGGLSFTFCSYKVLVPFGLPVWDGVRLISAFPIIDFFGGQLTISTTEAAWDTFNVLDVDIVRGGSYLVTQKVPEPSSYLLMMVGLGALAGFSLRRRSRQA